MPIIATHELARDGAIPSLIQHQTYCGLDSCVTLEVWDALNASHGEPGLIYNFEKALQAPYLELMQRGFRVNNSTRHRRIGDLQRRKERLGKILDELAHAVWDRPLNPNSPAQVKDFFYKAMALPEVWISKKGERKLSADREALEKLETYFYARPIVATILALRDVNKSLSVLESGIDPDGRFRSSYNIAGTENGRPSSSKNVLGLGGNAQNITPELRDVFVADSGMKMVVIDLEQVEARDVGFICGVLFDDWTFLDNCEGGDLHTNNAKLVWPHLPWQGDPKKDRAIADQLFYRTFSFRDMTKRGGHLSNYSGTAWTAARSLKVPLPVMVEFQARYCRGGRIPSGEFVQPAFPCIPRYWQWVGTQLQTKGYLETLFGRRRYFFGRPDDPATLREAIASVPQGTTADRMNLGLWRTWRHEPRAQLLAQTFDSITFQIPEGPHENSIIEHVLDLIRVELRAPNGRSYIVPGEAKVGWNWGYQTKDPTGRLVNPEGLVKWKPGFKDERSRAYGLARLAGGQ